MVVMGGGGGPIDFRNDFRPTEESVTYQRQKTVCYELFIHKSLVRALSQNGNVSICLGHDIQSDEGKENR